MAIKTFKPTTPSRRHMTVSAFEGIDKKAKPERSLVEAQYPLIMSVWADLRLLSVLMLVGDLKLEMLKKLEIAHMYLV